MILGRVVGQVWATRKNPRLKGLKLLLVRPHCWYEPDHEVDHVVCTDQVGAEVGQDVVVCLGLPGRQVLGDSRYPIEASIAAIVDSVELYSDAARYPRFEFRPALEPENLVWRERSER